MGLFNTFNISASGLTAQRLRLDVISNNIANADTTRTQEGGPYQRERVIFSERIKSINPGMHSNNKTPSGVRAVSIEKDRAPFKMVYDPSHPDANQITGYVTLPNVNIVTEMVDMISAARSYEANVTAINSTKSMISKTMEISKI